MRNYTGMEKDNLPAGLSRRKGGRSDKNTDASIRSRKTDFLMKSEEFLE